MSAVKSAAKSVGKVRKSVSKVNRSISKSIDKKTSGTEITSPIIWSF